MESHAQLGWGLAAVAGVLSFVSPCVLPLVPGYLSMISGLSLEELERGRGASLLRVFVSCVLFAIGLCVVYIGAGLGVGALGRIISPHMAAINVAFGIILILFGLFVLKVVRIPFLYQDRRLRLANGSLGLWSAPLLGFAFGFGWTPCIGPMVSLFIPLALAQPPLKAAILFLIFGGTFGLCFVIAGMLFAYALKTFSFLQRHHRAIEVVSGSLLIVMGLLFATQQWDKASALLNRLFQ